jgi:hypothetical protein
MSSLKDQILDLRDELMIAKDEGKLTPDGQKMLDQLDTKSWTTQGFGQFMQGLTANFSDNVVGSIKSFLSPAPANVAKQVGMGSPDQPAPSPSDVGVALERIGLEEYSKENPVKSVAANIAGAAMPAFLTKKPITSLPAQVGVTTASAFTSGLGESEAEFGCAGLHEQCHQSDVAGHQQVVHGCCSGRSRTHHLQRGPNNDHRH